MRARQGASSKEEILIIVGEVEFSKQIRVSDEERAVLCDRLFQLGEPISKIRQRAKNVERNATYKSIAFEYWLNGEDVFTRLEISTAVEQRLSERRRQLETIHLPIEELEKAGLVPYAEMYIRHREVALEPIMAKLKARGKRVRAFVLQTSEETRLEIKAIAERKGFGRDDPFWRTTLPIFAQFKLLDVVEKIMRRI